MWRYSLVFCPQRQGAGRCERSACTRGPWGWGIEPAGVIMKVALRRGARLTCPEWGEAMSGHRQRRWRHLDTCQYKTILVADVPRGEYSTHGVRQIEVPWGEERSGFTAVFETLVSDWLRETSQLAVARQLGLT